MAQRIRGHAVEAPASQDVGAGSLLELDDWEGAHRWPEDDQAGPELVRRDVDLWINANPNQPPIL